MTRLGISLCIAVTLPPLMMLPPGWAQTRGARSDEPTREAATEEQRAQERWEFTLDSRIGAPSGRLKVGEFPATGGTAGGEPGTRLRLSAAGIHVSEVLEGSVAFHLTSRDAIRAGYLYSFLRGDSTPGQSVVYNGEEFKPGHLHTNADFSRLSLAYERALLSSVGRRVVGSLGLTYVYFNPTLSGHGRSNSEDFYLQELPVPIAGLRLDQALGGHWLARLAVAGGGLPRVDSLRQEGGTVHLRQSHADTDAGLVYRWRAGVELELGYHFTYFLQHERSREDDNLFELTDSGARARVRVRF